MSASQDIQTFFDLAHKTLPIYVPTLPSLITSASVGLIIFAIGSGIALYDRSQTKMEKDVILKVRWMAILVGTVMLAYICSSFIQDKIYSFNSVKLNKQHYANIHWISKYKQAFYS